MALQPYPGLRPFEPDETDIFFGRESHVDAMVNRLAQHRLLAATGTSGSGKSSLVKAGLIEALEIGLLAEAGAVWHIAQLHPRDHPMAELAAALISALGGDRYEHDITLRRAALERGPPALVEELVKRPLPGGANLFILVDQFEELFRYRDLAGCEEAEAFVALLLASAGQRTVPIYIVLTMRSDYFGECAQFQGLAEAVSDAQKSLEIREELVKEGPPSNAKQRDLAVSHRRIGDVRMAQSHFDEAFAEYTESLKIDGALTMKDPINAEWQDDLAGSNEGIGEALKAQRRNKEALDAYKLGSDIRRTLAQKTPSNVVGQTNLAVNLYKMAFLSGDAKGNLVEAQELLRRLDAAGKLPPSARGWIAKVETALAEIKT